jgi:hypothetical protein
MTRGSDRRPAHCQAAAELARILTRDGPQRRRWLAKARARGLDVAAGQPCSEAIRLVIVEHLYESGESSLDPTDPDVQRKRPWKDRVYGVINATRMSRMTLEVFLVAFAIDGDDAAHLCELHEGAGLAVPTRP